MSCCFGCAVDGCANEMRAVCLETMHKAGSAISRRSGSMIMQLLAAGGGEGIAHASKDRRLSSRQDRADDWPSTRRARATGPSLPSAPHERSHHVRNFKIHLPTRSRAVRSNPHRPAENRDFWWMMVERLRVLSVTQPTSQRRAHQHGNTGWSVARGKADLHYPHSQCNSHQRDPTAMVRIQS